MSYDAPEITARFAEKYGITYPLLSDQGSVALRKLGVLNTELPPDHRAFGVAFPGFFSLDEAGKVTARRFYVDYRVRPVPREVLATSFGVVSADRSGAVLREADGIRAEAWLDSTTCRRGQVIGLNVEVDIPAGWHVYASPVPEGFQTTELEVAPAAGLEVGPLVTPKPEPFKVEGLTDEFHVFGGKLLLRRELTAVNLRSEVRLKATLAFQACNDHACLAPAELQFELPLKPLQHVAAP